MIKKHVVTGNNGDYVSMSTYELNKGKWELIGGSGSPFDVDVINTFNSEVYNRKMWNLYRDAQRNTKKNKPVVFYSMINPFPEPRFIGKGWTTG